MKKYALIFALFTFVSIVASAQPQLTWRFANAVVVNAGTQFQFDVEVKANSAGTFHRDLQVYFDYNTLGFGTDIVANGNVIVAPLALMNTHYFVVNTADNTSSKFAIITEGTHEMTQPGSAAHFNAVPTTFTGLLRFTIDIASNNQPAGIIFDAALMDGGQYYQSTTNTNPLKYAVASVYDNSLATTLLSSAYGTITYANAASTPLNNITVKLMDGIVEVGTSVSNNSGQYSVSSIPNGTYSIQNTTTKPRGGTDITDVVRTRQSMSGLWTFTPLQALAADVSGGGITITDVVLMRQSMSGIATPGWIAPNYVFLPVNITVAGGLGTVSYQGLCSGDPSPSFTPPIE